MDSRERLEAYLRDKKFPVLPVWKDGKPFQNYALELMWDAWQASRRAALDEAAQKCEIMSCRPEFEPEIQDRMLREAANSIRALANGDEA